MEVNKNNLLGGGAIFNFLAQKSRKIINWVGSFSFGVSQFRSKLLIFNNFDGHFSVGKIIYWVGNFGQWAG